MLKNPKEFYCDNAKNIVCVMNQLCAPSCEDGNEPLTFHHKSFSRMHFVMFNENKQAVTANIHVSELPGIIDGIKNCMISEEIISRIKAPTNEASNEMSAAYTTVISAGKLKGKTPASAILESTENIVLLKNQQKWLEENLSRYPKNAIQINAIKEALALYEKNALKKDVAAVAPSTKKYRVHDSGLRPLVRRKKSNGKAFVYQITIDYCESSQRPVVMTIKNFYSTVVQRENGLYNVTGDIEDEVSITFGFTKSSWSWFVHQSETQMRTFEDLNAETLYRKANEEEKNNRFNSGV